MMHEQLNHSSVNKRKALLSNSLLNIDLFLDNLSDIRNIAQIIRLADAANVSRIFYNNNIDLQDPKLKRVSRSTLMNTELHFADSIPNLFRIGLEWTNKSHNIFSYNKESLIEKRTILVIGNEKSGLSKPILQACDCFLHIPMYGKNTSMNVAMAAAIALYQLKF